MSNSAIGAIDAKTKTQALSNGSIDVGKYPIRDHKEILHLG